MNLRRILLLFLLNSFSTIIAQYSIPDSLKTKTYKDLAGRFYEHESDSILAKYYIDVFKAKALMQNDTIEIADSHFFMSLISKGENVVKYGDSIIRLTLNKKDKNYPMIGFLVKAINYNKNRNFKEALKNYLLADKYARLNNNIDYMYIVKFSIALLKSERLSNEEEAIVLLHDCYKYFNSTKGNKNNSLNSLFALADAFNNLGKHDSSSYYNRLGYQKAIEYKSDSMKTYFVMNEGATSVTKKKYAAAIDSIQKIIKSIEKFGDKPNLISCNFYLGKSYFELGETETSMLYFKKVDSLFNKTNYVSPEYLEAYTKLINYYKAKKDFKNQIKYINQRLKIDSIYKNDFEYLSKNIKNNYDIPVLLSEKEKIIKKLNKRETLSNKFIIIISTTSLLLIFLTIYLIFKNTRRKRRFEIIIKEYKIRTEKHRVKAFEKKTTQMPEHIKIESTKKDRTDIPEKLIKELIAKLDKFENKQLYLTSHYTLNSLAKEFKTNSTYLSKVINETKEVNFASYLNNLRIEYAIDQLKSNKTFRFYTIKAIAKEVGFKTAESFSSAFYKKTGIYPSYFIKELKKDN